MRDQEKRDIDVAFVHGERLISKLKFPLYGGRVNRFANVEPFDFVCRDFGSDQVREGRRVGVDVITRVDTYGNFNTATAGC